jgi:hypothetical protein
MKVGNTVRTAISLPGIPLGATGTVKETGRLFVLVSFEDGREGYYSRRQLTSVVQCACRGDGGIEETIPFGISDLRVPRGTHSCLLPSSESATLDGTARFAAAGLQSGETVICGVPRRWQSAFLVRLRQLGVPANCEACRQSLVIMVPSRFYLSASQFTGQGQLERTTSALTAACGGNPRGARAFAHVGDRPDLSGWWEYEEGITQALRDTGVAALCVYDRIGWGTEAWHRAIELHDYVVRDDHISHGGLAVAQ